MNEGFNHELKKFILTEVISKEGNMNFSNMGKKELSMVLQLLIEVNLMEERLEKKKLLEGYRCIYRIKAV